MQASTAWGHHAISGKERGSKGILSLLPPSPMREGGRGGSGWKGSFPVPVVVPSSCNCVILAAYSRVGHLPAGRSVVRTYVQAQMQRVKRGVDEEGGE